MKSFAPLSIALCMAFGSSLAMAQDTTKTDTKMETKKAMATEDCKEHTNTAKGQKRTDPPTAETESKCAGMTNPGMKKMHKDSMKSDAMKPDATTGTGTMAPAK